MNKMHILVVVAALFSISALFGMRRMQQEGSNQERAKAWLVNQLVLAADSISARQAKNDLNLLAGRIESVALTRSTLNEFALQFKHLNNTFNNEPLLITDSARLLANLNRALLLTPELFHVLSSLVAPVTTAQRENQIKKWLIEQIAILQKGAQDATSQKIAPLIADTIVKAKLEAGAPAINFVRARIEKQLIDVFKLKYVGKASDIFQSITDGLALLQYFFVPTAPDRDTQLAPPVPAPRPQPTPAPAPVPAPRPLPVPQPKPAPIPAPPAPPAPKPIPAPPAPPVPPMPVPAPQPVAPAQESGRSKLLEEIGKGFTLKPVGPTQEEKELALKKAEWQTKTPDELRKVATQYSLRILAAKPGEGKKLLNEAAVLNEVIRQKEKDAPKIGEEISEEWL